ncbi:MAG: glycosyltransferase family 39 protein [Proteobacteria bacterium]|jgi:4-amino-4-deoxy-L-arabinose transferase-like glycosyltransferase|nr:glycosyltransferase family 39 protein [Pseudomonadota bacterium]
MTGARRFPRLPHHAVGLALGVAYLAVLLATAKDVGFSRDEGFYFSAARLYQGWFDVLSDAPGRAVDPKIVKRFWEYNSEHPALMKTLFGFSERILHEKLGWLSAATALRLPGMLTGALAIYLIYLFGSFAFGAREGLFGALAFALIPQPFYHAHLCCFDMPVTAAWLLVVYLYWRSLSSTRFGVAAGIAFGFAVCVKLNALFLPFVVGLHYVLLRWAWRRRRAAGDAGAPPKPWAFVSGAIFAPIIFFAHWPWLWHDTVSRVGMYLGFHGSHVHYNTAYFGENVINAPTPISYPFVMTLFTISTVTIVLFFAGAFLRARHHLGGRRLRFVLERTAPVGPPSRDGLDLLLLIAGLFPIALIALPNVPIFGGTKHWMPAMPFITMIAGVGAARLADVAASLLRRWPGRLVGAAVVALLLLPPLQQTAASHPFGLAFYVPLIGGAPGAASLGMLRQFWGYTTQGVAPYLNAHVGKGGRAWFHDTAPPSVAMFREQGLVRRDIRAANRPQDAEFALLHHELHMIHNETWIWNAYRSIAPVHVLTYQGVPMVSVYGNPGKNGSRGKR